MILNGETGREGERKGNKSNGKVDIVNHDNCAASVLCIFMKSVAGGGGRERGLS